MWGEAIISKPCTTRHLTEEEIKQTFVKALNCLVEVKENVIADLQVLIDDVCQTVELTEERGRVEQELGVLAERLEMLIRENARVAQDQTAYLKQEHEIRSRYLEKQGSLEKLDEQISERDGKRKILDGMIQVICGINEEQIEFDLQRIIRHLPLSCVIIFLYLKRRREGRCLQRLMVRRPSG